MATSPVHTNFLPRNRLIAGMSLGVLVIEAAYRSGALSTSARASEYNREVFAVPGRLDSDFSTGTNALIRDQHAKLVTCPDDVIDELGDVGEALKTPAPDQSTSESQPVARPLLSDDEQAVHAVLDVEERSIEMIADKAGRSPAKVVSTLITLQLKGLARQLPGNLFVRTRAR